MCKLLSDGLSDAFDMCNPGGIEGSANAACDAAIAYAKLAQTDVAINCKEIGMSGIVGFNEEDCLKSIDSVTDSMVSTACAASAISESLSTDSILCDFWSHVAGNEAIGSTLEMFGADLSSLSNLDDTTEVLCETAKVTKAGGAAGCELIPEYKETCIEALNSAVDLACDTSSSSPLSDIDNIMQCASNCADTASTCTQNEVGRARRNIAQCAVDCGTAAKQCAADSAGDATATFACGKTQSSCALACRSGDGSSSAGDGSPAGDSSPAGGGSPGDETALTGVDACDAAETSCIKACTDNSGSANVFASSIVIVVAVAVALV